MKALSEGTHLIPCPNLTFYAFILLKQGRAKKLVHLESYVFLLYYIKRASFLVFLGSAQIPGNRLTTAYVFSAIIDSFLHDWNFVPNRKIDLEEVSDVRRRPPKTSTGSSFLVRMVEDDQRRPAGTMHQISADGLGLDAMAGSSNAKDSKEDENLW